MGSINEKLKKLYNEKIVGIEKKLEDVHYEDHWLDGPQLMYCREENYNNSNLKILFVGQESNSWKGDIIENTEDLMNQYKNFNFSNNSPFHNYIHWINGIINPNCNHNFLFTNVTKFCLFNEATGDGYPLDNITFEKTIEHFNVLKGEIEITKPDIVIFFSGPNYDEKIKFQFDEELTFKPVFHDIAEKKLAKVSGSILPKHTYRTYHPKYLQINKQGCILERLITHILKEEKMLDLCNKNWLAINALFEDLAQEKFYHNLKIQHKKYHDGDSYYEFWFEPYQHWAEIWMIDDYLEFWMASKDEKEFIELANQKFFFHGSSNNKFYYKNEKYQYSDIEALKKDLVPVLQELSI